MRTLLVGIVLLATGSKLCSQSGGDYQIRRSTIGIATAELSDGSQILRVSSGQAAATTLSGGDYELQGGYWTGATSTQGDTLFADGFDD